MRTVRKHNLIRTMVFCNRCGDEFKRETRYCKICPDCKKESRRLGAIKRRKTTRRLERRGF